MRRTGELRSEGALAEGALAKGKMAAEVGRKLRITEQDRYRSREEYGGPQINVRDFRGTPLGRAFDHLAARGESGQ